MEKIVKTQLYRSAVQDHPLSTNLTADEKRSEQLKNSPEFRALQGQIEKEIKSLTYSQPNLSDADRLVLAARVVIGRQPKKVSPTTNKDYIQVKKD